jgi:hypothetical protein
MQPTLCIVLWTNNEQMSKADTWEETSGAVGECIGRTVGLGKLKNLRNVRLESRHQRARSFAMLTFISMIRCSSRRRLKTASDAEVR